MVRFLQAIFDRIFAVIGALLFSQLPHFFQAYTQRLGGHLGELGMQIKTLQEAAARSGKSLEQYVEKFLKNQDPDIVMQGEFMQSLIRRFDEIRMAYQGMSEATPLTRPLHFIENLQPDIAKLTYNDFSFGLEFTPETGAYALIGMGVGMLFFVAINGFFTCFKRGIFFVFGSLKSLIRTRYA